MCYDDNDNVAGYYVMAMVIGKDCHALYALK